MCCTFEKSEMSNTRIYVGEAEKNGETVHVLAYQNKATSSGANAMVLPFPTETPMGPDNVIDTSVFSKFLDNISEASHMIAKSRGFRSDGLTLGAAGFDDNVAQVFDSGSYTVVLAEHVRQVPEALRRVQQDRRPQINAGFLTGYGKLYPKQPIALCCWNGAIEAEPLLWWYVPTNRSQLFIPTMDAHDGQAPRRGARVEVDHIISVGAVGPTGGFRVGYVGRIPSAVKELLPAHVHGCKLEGRLMNGDCFVKTADLHNDDVRSYVDLDRGWNNSPTSIDYSTDMNGWH